MKMNKENNDVSGERSVRGDLLGPNERHPYYEFETALRCVLRERYYQNHNDF